MIPIINWFIFLISFINVCLRVVLFIRCSREEVPELVEEWREAMLEPVDVQEVSEKIRTMCLEGVKEKKEHFGIKIFKLRKCCSESPRINKDFISDSFNEAKFQLYNDAASLYKMIGYPEGSPIANPHLEEEEKDPWFTYLEWEEDRFGSLQAMYARLEDARKYQ